MGNMEYDEYRAMNTAIQVAAEGDRDELEGGFQRVRHFIEDSEARFSRFREDSELCQLNRSAGTWFQASPELYELLSEALRLHTLTGGLFDPSILGALQRVGYDRSMDEIKAMGILADRDFSPMTSPRFEGTLFEGTFLDPGNHSVLLPPHVQIDFGGIAKGWIAGKAVQMLSDYAPACAVSIGGDIAFHGFPTGETAWQVSLENPLDEDDVLAVLDVDSAALATSSVSRRRWLQGNQARHHIIDPRTGFPAEVEWLSVSAGAPESTTAEAFAKAILIGGPLVGARFVEQFPGLWFIAVRPDGSLSEIQASEEMIYEFN